MCFFMCALRSVGALVVCGGRTWITLAGDMSIIIPEQLHQQVGAAVKSGGGERGGKGKQSHKRLVRFVGHLHYFFLSFFSGRMQYTVFVVREEAWRKERGVSTLNDVCETC